MLKNIPDNLNPELLKIMMEMGHGDELVIGDGNFAAAGFAKRLVRCDGLGTEELLKSILKFFPLDTFEPYPVTLMSVVDDPNAVSKIWGSYKKIIEQEEEKTDVIAYVERFDFYEKAKNAYAIVSTTERAYYACMILKKGAKPELID